LQQGELIEQGNHLQLLEKKGLYYRLHTTSQSSFDDATSNKQHTE